MSDGRLGTYGQNGMAEPWPCRLVGKTHLPGGRPVSLDRPLPGPWPTMRLMAEAVLDALRSRRDGGRPFIGEEVRVLTPLGQTAAFLIESEPNRDGTVWSLVAIREGRAIAWAGGDP